MNSNLKDLLLNILFMIYRVGYSVDKKSSL